MIKVFSQERRRSTGHRVISPPHLKNRLKDRQFSLKDYVYFRECSRSSNAELPQLKEEHLAC